MLSKKRILILLITIGCGLLTACGGNSNSSASLPTAQYFYAPNLWGNDSTHQSQGTISMYSIQNDGVLNYESIVSTEYYPTAITTLGGYAYVIDAKGDDPSGNSPGTVSIYTITNGVLSEFPESIVSTEYYPTAIAISGGHAYVTNAFGESASIDGVAQSVGSVSIYSVESNGLLNYESIVPTKYLPPAITISGGYAYVINQNGESNSGNDLGLVSIYSIESNGVLNYESIVPTEYSPVAIAISDGYAYVVNQKGESNDVSSPGTVSIYTINDGMLSKFVESVPTGYNPTAIAISGGYAYVTNAAGDSNDGSSRGSVSIYTITNGMLSKSPKSVPTGYAPTAIATLGSYAYVTNTYGESNSIGGSVGTVSSYTINNGTGELFPLLLESTVNTQYLPSFFSPTK